MLFNPNEAMKSGITEYFSAEIYPDGCSGKVSGHVPFVAMSDTYGIMNVNLTHGSEKSHYILGIYLRDQTDTIVQMQNFTRPAYLIPAPLTYSVEVDPKWTSITPYAFCNIHGVWKGLTYEIPPAPAEEALPSEVIAGCIFGAIVFLAGCLYTLNECGILSVLSESVAANEFFLAVVSLSWKMIDFSLTFLGLWELFNIKSPHWFRLSYCVFVGIHSVCFMFAMYAYVQLFYFYHLNDVIETPILGTLRSQFTRVLESDGKLEANAISMRGSAKYQMEKYRIFSMISLSGVFSFMLEDICGSFLALYALAEFEEASSSFIMITVCATQVFETGLSAGSFFSFAAENVVFEAAKYKYEHYAAQVAAKGDHEDDESL